MEHCACNLHKRLSIGIVQATDDFGDCLLIGIVQTIDFGDCLLIGIVQTIDFGDCLLIGIVQAWISETIHLLQVCEQ